MLLYMWSDFIYTNNTTTIIRQPSWALTEEQAIAEGTQSIRNELDVCIGAEDISDVYIFSAEFQPNENTIVALLNTSVFTTGANLVIEDDEATKIDIKYLTKIESKNVEPSPDDDESDEEEGDEFHIPKEEGE